MKLATEQIESISNLLIKSTDVLMQIYNQYTQQGADIGVEYKSDDSPVTKADMALHELIVPALAELTPDIYCLSEESADDISVDERLKIETLWQLDPVDGTKEYIKKSGQFTTNLALIHKQKVVAAWLVVPVERVMYFAQDNVVRKLDFSHIDVPAKQLTWQDMRFNANELTLSACKVIRVGLSNNAQLSDYEPFMQKLSQSYGVPTEVVRAGSAYKYAMMLENTIDIYVRAYPTCEWDTSSGQGLIESLGGELINFRGNPFLYNVRKTLKNGGFVCFKSSEDRDRVLEATHVLIEEA